MAKNTLKDMKNNLGDDENIADSSLDKMKQSRLKSLMVGAPVKIKEIFKKLFSSKKMIIITTAGVVLFISLGAAGIFFFGKSPEKIPENVPEKVKDTQDKAVVKKEIKAAAPLIAEVVFEDIVVLNPFERIQLKEGSGMKLISMNLSLELSDSRYKKEVHAMEEKIRQIITEQVEGMAWLELRNPEGKIMLKYELLKRMNSIFSEVMIRNIYFTNFLMQ